MARIAGVDLPRDKRVEVALTYIYGIGRSRAREILQITGINPDTRVRNLTEEEVTRLREVIDKNYKVEGDLRRELPVRGQRTRTNARTRKGPRRTVGTGRRSKAAPSPS